MTRTAVLLVMLTTAHGLVTSPVLSAAQSELLNGRWTASKPDNGVIVSLSLDGNATLVIPGTGPDGTVRPLTLRLSDISRQSRSVTFAVDLPDNEGRLGLLFRLADDDHGQLDVETVAGEPADADSPIWHLQRERTN